jgi:WD40 repeat protein
VVCVPQVLITQIRDHCDEVLDAAFSPDGTKLATCSRDLRTLIYEVTGDDWAFNLRASFTHRTAPCRICWHDDNQRLVICTEESSGDPFGGRSTAEMWHVSGDLLFTLPSRPFDVHTCWFGNHFITGGGITEADDNPPGRRKHARASLITVEHA